MAARVMAASDRFVRNGLLTMTELSQMGGAENGPFAEWLQDPNPHPHPNPNPNPNRSGNGCRSKGGSAITT